MTYAIRLSESAIVLKKKIRQNEQHLAMLKEEQTPSKFSEWVQQEVELETEKNRLSLAFREKNVEESRLLLRYARNGTEKCNRRDEVDCPAFAI